MYVLTIQFTMKLMYKSGNSRNVCRGESTLCMVHIVYTFLSSPILPCMTQKKLICTLYDVMISLVSLVFCHNTHERMVVSTTMISHFCHDLNHAYKCYVTVLSDCVWDLENDYLIKCQICQDSATRTLLSEARVGKMCGISKYE